MLTRHFTIDIINVNVDAVKQIFIKKESVDDHQLHQYQLNEQSTLTMTH